MADNAEHMVCKPKSVAAGFRKDMFTIFDLFTSNKNTANENDITSNGFNSDTIESNSKGGEEVLMSLRFSRFAKIWRDLKFEFIFYGRQTANELREFMDEIYLEVLSQLTTDKPLPTRVASLYLLYSLYVKQPRVSPQTAQQIRINLANLQSIRELIELAKQLEQFDVCYVWYKLLSIGGVHFVHVSRQMGPYFIRNNRLTSEAESRTDSLIDQFRASVLPHMEELSDIHEQYRIMKESLAEDAPNEMANINQVDDNIFELCKAKMDSLKSEFTTDIEDHQNLNHSLIDGESEEFPPQLYSNSFDDIGSRRREIKKKAMTSNSSNMNSDNGNLQTTRKRGRTSDKR